MRATASLSNVNGAKANKMASIENSIMSEGQRLTSQYPTFQLQLIENGSAFSSTDLNNIRYELKLFENAMQTTNPEEVLGNTNFQYLTCLPCGNPKSSRF